MIVDHEPRLLADRYRLGEPVGAGGMGTVYAAFDLRLDRAVAVKLLRADFARDPGLRRRFEREARSAARVSHHNAVAVYDTGEDAEHDAFIVMELLSGRTLAHEIADGRLTEPRLHQIADGVLAALGAAHDEGIVHRDVKPGNVLLGDDGAVKVGDFGIATSLDATETTAGLPLGTPAYSAPERLRGLPATPASDLYSLGIVLYEAATGERPFGGGGPAEIAQSVVRGAHRPLRSSRPDLDPALVAAIERAMATDPLDRFPDAATMRSALAGRDAAATATPTVPLADGMTTATLHQPAPPRTAPAPGRVRAPGRDTRRAPRSGARRLAAIAALVAVLAVVGAVLLTQNGNDPATTTPTTPTAAAPAAPAAPAGGAAAADTPAPIARALDRLEGLTKP